MRKFLLFACFIISTTIASAQITKGSTLLGGNISYASQKYEYSNGNTTQEQSLYTVGLNYGKAIKQNLLVGGGFNYGHSESEIGNTPNPKTNIYEAQVFLRKYFQLGKIIYVYGEPALTYGQSKTKEEHNTDYRTENTGWSATLDLTPGLAFALTPKFHLEIGLNDLVYIGYGQQENKTFALGNVSSSKTTNFGFHTALNSTTSFNVGFRFLLAK